MKLLLDTSAVGNIPDGTSDALARALEARRAEVYVPTSVVFELRNRTKVAEGSLLSGSFRFGSVAPPGLEWLYDRWQRGGVTGRVLEFNEQAAEGLADWLADPGRGRTWFAIGKLRKCWEDSAPVRNKAISSALNEARWATRADHNALKDHINRHGAALLAPDSSLLDAPVRVSATIDWLHLGTAIEHGLTLVSDDHGAEFPADVTWSCRKLYGELQLDWPS